jgi:hypothetical protein
MRERICVATSIFEGLVDQPGVLLRSTNSGNRELVQ